MLTYTCHHSRDFCAISFTVWLFRRAEHSELCIWFTLPFRIGWWHQSSAITWPASAVGVAPCGNHSSSRKRRGAGGCTPSRVEKIRFWRRTFTARPPHRLVSLSVLQQCVWAQTGGQWMPIRRKESFYKETKFASFFLIISSDKKSKRPE